MNTITTEELKEKRQADTPFALINVLPEEQYKKLHIPGSKNVPLTDEHFERRVEKFAGSKDREVIVHCTNESCDLSRKAAKKLESAGFTRVAQYKSGIEGWQGQGLPVENGLEIAGVR